MSLDVLLVHHVTVHCHEHIESSLDLLCVIVRHSRSLPIRSAERIPPDGPINRDAIASRDSRPEEGASRTQRVHALALLPRERSPARALRWGIPRGIARSNHQTPNDRTTLHRHASTSENRLAAKNFRILRYNAAHARQNTALF